MDQQDVIDLIAEHLGVAADQIQLQSDFEKDLGADSLDTADLFLAVKEAFDVLMSEEDIERIKTVQDLINKIEDKKIGKNKRKKPVKNAKKSKKKNK